MMINTVKSTLSLFGLKAKDMSLFQRTFPFSVAEIDVRLKYLGFKLKPNSYKVAYWVWLIEN